MMASTVEVVDAHRLVLPLERSYHLSFGTLDRFELFLVAVRVDGREGLGECVPLPGYSPESADAVWTSLTERGIAVYRGRGRCGPIRGASSRSLLLSPTGAIP